MPLPYDIPPSELAVELEEVRRDAAALVEHLLSANMPLPTGFPTKSALNIAAALCDLPNGTAEGCRRPLFYAQAQLAAMRGRHIKIEHSIAPSTPADSDSEPSQVRQGALDLRLTTLMNSVSTAFQVAERLAGEHEETEVDLERRLTPPSRQEAIEIGTRAEEVEAILGADRDQLDQMFA
jgi:hypothetical protein